MKRALVGLYPITDDAIRPNRLVPCDFPCQYADLLLVLPHSHYALRDSTKRCLHSQIMVESREFASSTAMLGYLQRFE